MTSTSYDMCRLQQTEIKQKIKRTKCIGYRFRAAQKVNTINRSANIKLAKDDTKRCN